MKLASEYIDLNADILSLYCGEEGERTTVNIPMDHIASITMPQTASNALQIHLKKMCPYGEFNAIEFTMNNQVISFIEKGSVD